MGLVGMWLRLELRRRWRSLLVLALLVALSSGTVLAAVAGARRGESALDRLLEATVPATTVVQPNEPGFDWNAVRAMPGVAAVATFAAGDYFVDGMPVEDFATGSGSPYGAPGMDTIERPVVLAGRLADPARADEAVITAGLAADRGLGVGDTVRVQLHEASAIDAGYFTPDSAGYLPPAGPVIDTRIVGVVRSLVFSERPGQNGVFIPSTGLLAQYRPNLLGSRDTEFENALVRLDGGPAALPAFRKDLAVLTGRSDIGEFDLGEAAAKVRRTTAFESASLLAFGLAALAAAIVLVGQAVARYAAAAVANLRVLRAIGMAPRHAVLAASAGPALAAVAGTCTGVAAAIGASAWLPFGNAAPLEPTPGIDVDALVLVPGALLTLLLVAGGAAAAAGLSMAGLSTAGLSIAGVRSTASTRRSVVATAAARIGLPVPVVIGARFALEPGRGPSALPVRPALFGAVTGVLGVVAAFTLSAGVTDAGDNPARFGQTAQIFAFLGVEGTDFLPAGPLLAATTADPDVTAALDAPTGVLQSGATTFTAYSYGSRGTQPFPTVVLRGAMPQRAGEVVLGPTVAAELGVDVGDPVALTGTRGSATATVSGVGFVLTGPHNDYDNSAWLSPAGYDELIEGFTFHLGFVALRPGADPDAALRRISTAAAAAAGIETWPLQPIESPIEVTQIRTVQVLPVVLGAFLALLAVGAVGHALATAVRRRRHDVAVLRALGMTRRQARGTVVTQATVLAVVGLLFGVPLGLAVGRMLWRVVADITPLQYEAPFALLALLLVAPLTVLIANALGAWPGRQAARLRISHVLRAE